MSQDNQLTWCTTVYTNIIPICVSNWQHIKTIRWWTATTPCLKWKIYICISMLHVVNFISGHFICSFVSTSLAYIIIPKNKNWERVRPLLSMCWMLLGYSFEPRPNSCALGTEDSVMTISLSINKRSQLKKPEWQDKIRLISLEVWAAVTSKTWHNSGRATWTSFSSPLQWDKRSLCLQGAV